MEKQTVNFLKRILQATIEDVGRTEKSDHDELGRWTEKNKSSSASLTWGEKLTQRWNNKSERAGSEQFRNKVNSVNDAIKYIEQNCGTIIDNQVQDEYLKSDNNQRRLIQLLSGAEPILKEYGDIIGQNTIRLINNEALPANERHQYARGVAAAASQFFDTTNSIYLVEDVLLNEADWTLLKCTGGDRGYHPSEAPGSILCHELAHLLDKNITERHNFSKSLQDKLSKANQRMEEIMNNFYKTNQMSEEEQKEFMECQGINEHIPGCGYEISTNICNILYGDNKDIGDGICIYAKNNAFECFAEAMTDAIYNGEKAKPMSKKIKKCFDLFNEARKGGDEDWYYNTTQKLKNGEINLDE